MQTEQNEISSHDERLAELQALGWSQQRGSGPFFQLVGPLLKRRTGDVFEYAMLAEHRHLNSAGVVHGGLLVSLIDQVISQVVWYATDRSPMATVQLDSHFLAPAREGDLIVASARITRKARSLAFVTGELAVDDTTVLMTQAIMKLKAKQ